MSEHLNPLGPLVGGPVPPLADPSAVRARGEQRRRRERAALAATGVLAAFAVVGGVLAVSGSSSKDDALLPADPPSASVTAPPSAEPSASLSPPATAPATTPPAVPLSPSGPAATSAGPSDVELLPATTLPDAADLGPFNWVRHASQRDAATSQPAFDPCGRDQRLPAADRVAFLSGSYRIEEEDQPGVGIIEGPGLYDEVARYSSDERAQAAFDELAASATTERCSGYEANGSRYVFDVLGTDPVLIEQTTGAIGQPLYPFPVYSGVVRVGELVAVFEYNPGEQVDREGAQQMVSLIRAGLCRTAGDC